MLYSQVIGLLSETALSPEDIARRISVSNSTYRRWLKASRKAVFPESYRANVASGVYKLLAEGLLKHDSAKVKMFLEQNLPDFFSAAIAGLKVTPDMLAKDCSMEDNVTAVLSHLGSSNKIRTEVERSTSLPKFSGLGKLWKSRIGILLKVIKDKKPALVDKLVAYGALFYIVHPFDLIPDAIPVFGVVDDFGILSIAAAYYGKKVFTRNTARKPPLRYA